MAEMTLRPEVAAFAQAMERNLRKHDVTRGVRGWMNDEPLALLGRVHEEAGELGDVIPVGADKPDLERILSEAADVANMAMMVADACGALRAQEVA